MTTPEPALPDWRIINPLRRPLAPRPAGVILHSVTGLFHPVLFVPDPAPSATSAALGVTRYRIIGLDTDGFSSLEYARSRIGWMVGTHEWVDTGLVWGWTGVGPLRLSCWFTPGHPEPWSPVRPS